MKWWKTRQESISIRVIGIITIVIKKKERKVYGYVNGDDNGL